MCTADCPVPGMSTYVKPCVSVSLYNFLFFAWRLCNVLVCSGDCSIHFLAFPRQFITEGCSSPRPAHFRGCLIYAAANSYCRELFTSGNCSLPGLFNVYRQNCKLPGAIRNGACFEGWVIKMHTEKNQANGIF